VYVVTDILSKMQGAILFHSYVIVCLPKAPRKTFEKVKYETQSSEEEKKTWYLTSQKDHFQNNSCAELYPLLSKHLPERHLVHSELL